jgi:hypothetical protein
MARRAPVEDPSLGRPHSPALRRERGTPAGSGSYGALNERGDRHP